MGGFGVESNISFLQWKRPIAHISMTRVLTLQATTTPITQHIERRFVDVHALVYLVAWRLALFRTIPFAKFVLGVGSCVSITIGRQRHSALGVLGVAWTCMTTSHVHV